MDKIKKLFKQGDGFALLGMTLIFVGLGIAFFGVLFVKNTSSWEYLVLGSVILTTGFRFKNLGDHKIAENIRKQNQKQGVS